MLARDAVDPRHLDRLWPAQAAAGSRRSAGRASSCPFPAARSAGCCARPPRRRSSALTAWCWPRTSLRSGLRGESARSRAGSACGRRGQRIAGSPRKHPRRARQRSATATSMPSDQHRLTGVRAGEDEVAQPASTRRLCHRQRSPAGPHLAVERQLPEQHVALQPLARQLTARRKHGARERQVQAGARLRHVPGREVRCDPPAPGTRTPSCGSPP